MRGSWLVAAFIAIVFIGSSPDVGWGKDPAEGYEEIASQLRDIVRREIDAKDIPAMSIALIDGDQTVWTEGFGFSDAAKMKPATEETVYRVGSVSKLFTDVAVMQLVEEGQFQLDVPVQTYIPSFRPKNPFDVPITLRQLMSHRSGLVRESPVGNYFDPTGPSIRRAVASLSDTALVYRPDTKTKYSNAGITVVGHAIEATQNVPFSQWMDEAVLKPLGMHNSSFV